MAVSEHFKAGSIAFVAFAGEAKNPAKENFERRAGMGVYCNCKVPLSACYHSFCFWPPQRGLRVFRPLNPAKSWFPSGSAANRAAGTAIASDVLRFLHFRLRHVLAGACVRSQRTNGISFSCEGC